MRIGREMLCLPYAGFFREIINLEECPNLISGSRVMVILLNLLILPIGGASAVEGLLSTGPSPSSLNNNKEEKKENSVIIGE